MAFLDDLNNAMECIGQDKTDIVRFVHDKEIFEEHKRRPRKQGRRTGFRKVD